ncbi:hypothetical protein MKX01_041890 [Papaver californicum]|nr:hypothetical protein MKX01_041890 [Papaver californicum]
MAAGTATAVEASGCSLEEDYISLNDLKFEIDKGNDTFSLCTWIYLLRSTSSPATIIRQIHSGVEGDASFLVLNKEKQLTLLPLLFLHEEATQSSDSVLWAEVPSVTTEFEFPLEKWIHVGCEVSINVMRLHVDGVLVGENPLTSFSKDDSGMDKLKRLTLAGSNGDNEQVQGFVHYPRILPPTSSINGHFVENPPVVLSIDNSSTSEIEEGEDGVWSIVGGKASCRRNFSLDVVLLDAFSHPVNKEMEVVASLQYADNGLPVEKPNDAEAPLLTSYDGIEFASSVRPSKLMQGRASFKLKISQLSSKCDSRLFRLHFVLARSGKYPFLEAFSHPVRCISRSRNNRATTVAWAKATSAVHPLNGPQPMVLDDESPETQHNNVDSHPSTLDLIVSPNSKRVKVGGEMQSVRNQADPNADHSQSNKQGDDAFEATEEGKPKNLDKSDNTFSDTESVQARKLNSVLTSSYNTTSDFTIFKYCLGGINDRLLLLKEIVSSATNQEIMNFAQQITIYTGCSHHRYPISIAKALVQEGNHTWFSISKGNRQVLWKDAICEIEQQFMKISRGTTRSLTTQDLELLRRIAGCGDNMTQENFDKMWHWLYPVAFTLSRDWINATWGCISPKWIEGLVTKEEAEASLRGPRGCQEPGTFILRFPTSRSWPHPDAGSLIVTYVGADYTLHHRLLALENRELDQKPLQVLLLAEPQLTALGRVARDITTFA